MAKIVNYISSFNPQFWKIGGFGLYETKYPINIDSLGGNFAAWFDAEGEKFLTEKQLTAWGYFCKISPTNIKKMIIEGLAKLSKQMDLLPTEVKLKHGAIYSPKVVSRNAKKVIETMSKNNKPIDRQSKSVFLCNSIVIPKQDKTSARFIVMNFQIGRRPYELEAVFCNEEILIVGENSGLWTRLDWNYEFNVPDFNAKTALHPYWQ